MAFTICIECGAPGELMSHDHFALVCKNCRIKDLEGYVQQRNKDISDISMALKISTDSVPFISDLVKQCIAVASRVEVTQGISKRFKDTTPADKPRQEVITCDVGADWDD